MIKKNFFLLIIGTVLSRVTLMAAEQPELRESMLKRYCLKIAATTTDTNGCLPSCQSICRVASCCALTALFSYISTAGIAASSVAESTECFSCLSITTLAALDGNNTPVTTEPRATK